MIGICNLFYFKSKHFKMERLKNIIETELLNITNSLHGFSIFGYNNKQIYDIYIPTKTIENFYFVTYIAGSFYDLYSNQISLSQIEQCKYLTKDIIDKNYSKILQYTEIFIEEHDMLSYTDYKSPIETGAEDFFELGNKAFEIGDYNQAFNNYNIAINLKPYDPSLYSKRANCFIKCRQYENAIADICRAGIANPISQQNIFIFTFEDIGDVYRLANDFDKAIKYFSVVIENNEQLWVFQKRAMCYSKIGQFNLAIQDLESFLKKDRKIEILFELGEIYLKARLNSKAKIILDEVINFSNNNQNEWVYQMVENKNRPIKDDAKRLMEQL